MRPMRSVRPLLLVLALASLLPACSRGDLLEASTFPPESAVTLIDWRSLYDASVPEHAHELRDLGVDGLILDASQVADSVDGAYAGPSSSTSFDVEASRVLCELQATGVNTDVVIGAPEWAGEDLRYLVLRSVEHLARNPHWRECPPRTVYLDIEPYGEDHDRVEGLSDLAATVEAVADLRVDVRLGVFVPAWLPEVPAAERGDDPPFERIVRALRPGDLVAGMTYRRKVDGDNGLLAVTERFGRDIREQRDDVRFTVGVETDHVEEAGVSFSGTSRRTVVSAVTDVTSSLPPSEGFDGVFVNSLEGYLALSR